MVAAERKATFIETLRKFPDFSALIQAAEAGAIGSSGSMISSLTSDFNDSDENSREAKASAETLRIMAQFFSIKHDDILKAHGGSEDADAEDAFLDIDDMRSELVEKLWAYHEAVTTRWFPGTSAKDVRGRRSAGNRINNILDKYLHARHAVLSKQNYGDPLFAVIPPTKTDFSNTLRRMSERASALATEKPDSADDAAAKESGALEKDGAETDDEAEEKRRQAGDARAAGWVASQEKQNIQPDNHKNHNDDDAEAIATEEENKRLEQVLREEKGKNIRLREELKNLEAIQNMQQKERQQKKRKRENQENVKTIQAKNHEMMNKIKKIRCKIDDEANESADKDDDDAIFSIENNAASTLALPAPTPTILAPSQPDFSKLIHSLEIDAVRRNVVGVRPKEPFQKYDPKKKGQYNMLMNSFDSAFGGVEGISGNEKVTELAGHWFAGAARKAINAAKPTVNDPLGHLAYAKVRTHLDSIYGQNVDSAAEALANLKEGGVVAKDNITAYQDLYMNMLEAESSAVAVNSMELLNRRTSLLEIMAARIPFYIEKFFEDYEDGDGYQTLLDFVHTRIKLLRNTQLPEQKTQLIKIHVTEARELADNSQRYGPMTYTQELRESPRKEEKTEKCAYCQGLHKTTLCNRLLILSLPERIAIANKARMCFHCMDMTHNAKDCPEKNEISCSLCGRKGHITMFHGRNILNANNPSDRSRQNAKDAHLRITDPPTQALMDIHTIKHNPAEKIYGRNNDDDTSTESETEEENELL